MKLETREASLRIPLVQSVKAVADDVRNWQLLIAVISIFALPLDIYVKSRDVFPRFNFIHHRDPRHHRNTIGIDRLKMTPRTAFIRTGEGKSSRRDSSFEVLKPDFLVGRNVQFILRNVPALLVDTCPELFEISRANSSLK